MMILRKDRTTMTDICIFRPPKRDWRDWFIMATVMGGVSYGLYFVAKVCIPVAWCTLPLTALALYHTPYRTPNSSTDRARQANY